MTTLTKYGRFLVDLRLALAGHDRVENVPTETFNQLVKDHLDAGWRKTYAYGGFDAWIDYGRVDLRKDGQSLTFEWDNWSEGRITGPAQLIQELAATHGLQLAAWRRLARRQPRRSETEVKAVWSHIVSLDVAKLVTVHFFDE